MITWLVSGKILGHEKPLYKPTKEELKERMTGKRVYTLDRLERTKSTMLNLYLLTN